MSRGKRKQARSTPGSRTGRDDLAQGAAPSPLAASRSSRALPLTLLLIAILLVLAYGVARWLGASDLAAGAAAEAPAGPSREPPDGPPGEVPRVDDLESLDPAVAQAIAAAVAGVERGRSSGTAWGELGLVYHAHRFFALARRCYTEAARLDPSSSEWPHLLGVLAEERGDVEEAAARYEAELALAPAHDAARYRLGNVLLQAGSVDDAARAFERLVSSTPAKPWGALGLGRVALRRGSAAQAARQFERALAVDPDNAQAAYLLASAYRVQGNQSEAGRLAERARDGVRPGGPADPILDRVRAGVRSLQSMVAAANQTLAAGNAEAAEAIYASVLGFDPAHYDALYNLGILYGRQQRDREAQAVLERAVRARPQSSQARLLLALALASQDRLDAARGELGALLERDPGHAEAKRLLAEMER